MVQLYQNDSACDQNSILNINCANFGCDAACSVGSCVSSDAAAAGIDTARALTDRMAEVTSGFLAGVSEAVRPRDRKP
jgi:hypothetical protein